MRKLFSWMLVASALAFASCSEDRGTSTETNENDSSTPDNASGTDSTATSYNYDAEYRDRADRMSRQVSQDLKLDTATQSRLRTVYYNRARQMQELEARYTATNRSAGLSADSNDQMNQDLMAGEMDVSKTELTYAPAYYRELESLNSNTDAELQGYLSSDQFKLYNANRKKYYDQDLEYLRRSGAKDQDDEAKYEADGIKIKRDGDELKIKTDDLKIKREGDEAKIKTENGKMKREGDEVKVKTDDSKIKIEN